MAEDTLGAALGRLEGHLRKDGAAIGYLLRPGLSREELYAALDGVFDNVPAEVETWFAWHDGAPEVPEDEDFRDETWLPNRQHLLPIRWALSQRAMLLEECSPELSYDSHTFQSHWLPIVGADGWWLVADMRGPDVAPVHQLWIQDGDWREVAEPSILSMVQAWNTAFEAGRYAWDRVAGCWQDYEVDPDHPKVT